ncbi:hypothetical protein M3Y94_00530600 [Aphelenchoides besseyi]|nr:hypothetical protein M3Y94_00530600 [Aphelenchoides besseyi]KAI6225865.1 Anillin domain-containing protein [Aphelenchoides besseyi]
MLKYARTPSGSISAAATSSSTPTVSSMRPVINRKTSFVTSECGYSKATVVLKNVTVPLAWPSNEYFGQAREHRTFVVQLIIRTEDGKEVFSKPVENVDRSCIDCVFDDIFYIEDQPPDFKLEVTVYCRRTDENATANFVQTFSRSVGRSVANSLKRYMQSVNSTNFAQMQQADANYFENYRDPSRMFMLASVIFQLKNASLSGKKHNYGLRLSPQNIHTSTARSHLLPLFGQISLVMLVQPLSLAAPLAQGTMDVFYVEGGILLQKLFCVLQGTFLKCYNSDPKLVTYQSKADMTLPINEFATLEFTAFQTALRLKLTDPETGELRHFICVAGTQGSFIGWKNAFKLQVKDAEVWNEFALAPTNPHGATIPPRGPRYGTASRNVHFDSGTTNRTVTLNTFAPEPRYGMELQSTRRRTPITVETFKNSPLPPRAPQSNDPATSEPNYKAPSPAPPPRNSAKPVPKPRAASQIEANNANVILLKIGADDELPPPSTNMLESSSTGTSEDSTTSESHSPTSQPLEQPEVKARFVYGIGTGLQLIRSTPTITRSNTLYNERAKNQYTRL